MSTRPTSTSLVQLLCFVRVVEAGSFAEAGRQIGITTSGVSKAINRLETAYGLRLLHRSTHSMSLTEEGETLLAEAREALRGFDRLETALGESAGGGRAGRVRLSAPTAFVRACLVPAIAGFRAHHPDIILDVRGSDGMVDLADEGVDIALRTGRVVGTPGHIMRTLFSFPFTACATPDYLARRGTPSTPRDLGNHDLIGFRNSGTGRVQPWRFRSTTSEQEVGETAHVPDARIVFDDALSAWEVARTGHGIAWAPEWLARNDLRSGCVAEVLKTWRSEEMPMSLLRRDRKLTPKRIESVIAFLVQAAGDWSCPRG